MSLPLCNLALLFREGIKVEKKNKSVMQQNIIRRIKIEWAIFIQAEENILGK